MNSTTIDLIKRIGELYWQSYDTLLKQSYLSGIEKLGMVVCLLIFVFFLGKLISNIRRQIADWNHKVTEVIVESKDTFAQEAAVKSRRQFLYRHLLTTIFILVITVLGLIQLGYSAIAEDFYRPEQKILMMITDSNAGTAPNAQGIQSFFSVLETNFFDPQHRIIKQQVKNDGYEALLTALIALTVVITFIFLGKLIFNQAKGDSSLFSVFVMACFGLAFFLLLLDSGRTALSNLYNPDWVAFQKMTGNRSELAASRYSSNLDRWQNEMRYRSIPIITPDTPCELDVVSLPCPPEEEADPLPLEQNYEPQIKCPYQH